MNSRWCGRPCGSSLHYHRYGPGPDAERTPLLLNGLAWADAPIVQWQPVGTGRPNPPASIIVADISGNLTADSMAYAEDIASHCGARLRPLSFVQIPAHCEDIHDATRQLKRLARQAGHRGDQVCARSLTPAHHQVLIGRPSELLTQAAGTADLLIVGRRTTPWLDRGLDVLFISQLLDNQPPCTTVVVVTGQR